MAIIQPTESPTQSFQERDGAESLKGYSEGSYYTKHLSPADFFGSGNVPSVVAPYHFPIGAGEVARANFIRPSYWWNGELKVTTYWIHSTTDAGDMNVDIQVRSFREGEAASAGILIEETGDVFSNITADELGIHELTSETAETNNDITEDDDIILVKFDRASDGVVGDFGIVGVKIEYFPRILQ